MNYAESKKQIDKIRKEYGCTGDVLFRSALQIVVEAGQTTILDDAWYQCEVDDIYERHNLAKAEGKTLFIAKDFELAILECAKELSKVNSYDLLMYVQKEVWLSGYGIDYKRAIELLKDCINSFNYDPLNQAREIGFDDSELEELGFRWMLDEEEANA